MSCKGKSACGQNRCCIDCEDLATCKEIKCELMDCFEFARECEDYVEDLKPCPFCGEKVELVTKTIGHDGNYFYEGYSIKCKNCGIDFQGESKFYVDNGLPHVKYDGYQELVDRWNKRPAKED